MADEIKQARNIGQVQPLSPSRDAGRRKRPRPPPDKAGENARERPADDGKPHQVDEYV